MIWTDSVWVKVFSLPSAFCFHALIPLCGQCDTVNCLFGGWGFSEMKKLGNERLWEGWRSSEVWWWFQRVRMFFFFFEFIVEANIQFLLMKSVERREGVVGMTFLFEPNHWIFFSARSRRRPFKILRHKWKITLRNQSYVVLIFNLNIFIFIVETSGNWEEWWTYDGISGKWKVVESLHIYLYFSFFKKIFMPPFFFTIKSHSFSPTDSFKFLKNSISF